MAGRDSVRAVISGAGDLAAVANAARAAIEGVGTISMAQALSPIKPDFVFAEIAAPHRVNDTTWVVHGSLTVADSTVRARTRARLVDEFARLARPGCASRRRTTPASLLASPTTSV